MADRIELTEGYSISRVLNGLWQLSEGHSLNGPLDVDDIKKAFHQLVESGFTTFDLADIYVGAEDVLGSFLKEHTEYKQEDIQIHEKYVPDLSVLETVSFEDTERIIDRSLKKLGRDYIDLIQYHWWDFSVPRYVEVAQNLVKLQEKGKIKHIGVTNFDTPHLKELVDAGIPIVSCQSQYSLFDRRIEKQLLDYCKSVGIEHIAYGTLAGGFLSEKYLGKTNIEPETRSQVKYKQIIEETLGLKGYQTLLGLLKDIADKHQVNIANVATKYILAQPGVAATIIGVRNSKHVESNKQIFSFTLDKGDVQKIDSFIRDYPIIEGEPYELERTPNSRFRNIIRMNEAEK